jgi:hypothetical protein
MGLHRWDGQHIDRLESEALLTALAKRVVHIELAGNSPICGSRRPAFAQSSRAARRPARAVGHLSACGLTATALPGQLVLRVGVDSWTSAGACDLAQDGKHVVHQR